MALNTQLGRTGRYRKVIDVAPTITAGAYSLNDAVGGRMTFANASHGAGQSGVIEALRIVDRAQQMVALDLFLFDQAFTAVADNAPFAVSDADMENYVGTIPISVANYADLSTNSGAAMYPVGLPYITVGSYNLYGQLVVRSGPPTYVATSDLRIRLSVKLD